MEIKLIRKKTAMPKEGGIPFCEVSITLPHAVDGGREGARVERFYEGLANAAMRMAEALLLPYAKRKFEEDSDPRRHLTHRPYRLILQATVKKEGGATAVTRTLSITHRGRTLYREEVCERILPEGRILPGKKKSPKTC